MEADDTTLSAGPARARRFYPWVPAAALFALGGAFALSRAHRLPDDHARGALPALGEIPAFSMPDQRGQPVTSASLRGQVLIADFFYATCPTSCPRLSAQMAAFQERLSKADPKLPVHLLSITLDPENDTPDVLREYALRYHADDARWSFLSGRSEELDRLVVKGFKVAFERADPSAGLGSIMHGEWFVLVDRSGRIRGYYQISDEERMSELYRDAARLAGQGAGA